METLAPTDWSRVADSVTENESRYAMDSKLYVQFYTRPILMQSASDQAGRPIYEDVDCIRILVPGDKLSQVDRQASDDDKKRFAEHYNRYKSGKGQEVVGTRLEAVPWMTRSKVEEYRYFNIVTVEQLAGASDEVGQKFPGFHADREKAKKFLDSTQGTDARVKELEEQVAKLLAAQSPAKVPVKA